jgi:hypothetical protein
MRLPHKRWLQINKVSLDLYGTLVVGCVEGMVYCIIQAIKPMINNASKISNPHIARNPH